MTDIREWLVSIGIPGIERLSEEFETRGFTSKKSLQYLTQGDLDMIFSSPKRLLLAEKRALELEIRRLQEDCLQPRKLVYDYSITKGQFGKQPATPVNFAISKPAAPCQPEQQTPQARAYRECELFRSSNFQCGRAFSHA